MVKRDLRLTPDNLARLMYGEPHVLDHSASNTESRKAVFTICVAALERRGFTENGPLYSPFHVQYNSEIGLEQVTPFLMIRPSWLVVKIQIHLC